MNLHYACKYAHLQTIGNKFQSNYIYENLASLLMIRYQSSSILSLHFLNRIYKNMN